MPGGGGGFHTSTYSMLFNQLVQNIVMCNACIWGHTVNRNILNLQLNAMHFLLGVGRTCWAFWGTGWVPFLMTIKFRNSIMNIKKDRITSNVYAWSLSLAGPKFQNWAWKTRTLLESIKDYGGVLTIDEIWNELMKLELYNWKMTVDEIPKESETGRRFCFYRKIKASPTEEDYIQRSSALNKIRVIIILPNRDAGASHWKWRLAITVPKRSPYVREFASSVTLILALRPTFCFRVPLLLHPEKN